MSATASRLHGKGRVAIVEADREIATLIESGLGDAGFVAETSSDRASELRRLRQSPPDLLIMDWGLPPAGGANLLMNIRSWPGTRRLPIVVVIPIRDEAEIIRAFELGADDVVRIPFFIKEIIARVEALLRYHTSTKQTEILTAGDIELDRDGMRVRRRGKIVELGPLDYRLLELFLQNPGRVLGREEIIEAVWGDDSPVDDRTIDVHVGRLRKALLTASRRNPIATVRGAGYRLDTH